MIDAIAKDDSHLELERLKGALWASGDVVYDWDLATDHIAFSGDVAALFESDNLTVPASGEDLQLRISPEDIPRRRRILSDHFAGSAAYDCEYRIRSGQGEFQWLHDRGSVQYSAAGTPARMTGVIRLVTLRKKHEERLQYLANFDDLTGHYNKLRMREALEHALTQSQRFGQPGVYMVIGVDHLDRINTGYGYEVGDAVLVEIGRRLDNWLRAADVIGRPSGDCFGALLSVCSEEKAQIAAERILQSMRDQPIVVGQEKIHVTVSIGSVAFSAQSKTAVDAMTKAESALQQAKTAGRDCLRFFELTEAQRQDYRASMDIGEEVQQALKDNRIVLAYQPVVDAQSHVVRYFECLVRMYDREGALVPAAQFVPAIEQLGLMRSIDNRVRDLAIAALERFPNVNLAINISGLTATEHSWQRGLVARLKDRRDLASRLIVEITETTALMDIDETSRFVFSLRGLGCEVALDDFGAGFTTFHHLRALTVDVVKIDGSFIHHITSDKQNQIFIRNLLALAGTLGVSTVAECVETKEEADYLSAEGVDLLQGYYFGRPDIDDRLLTFQQGNQARIKSSAVGD
ncbi:EAL domain-containing protein [Pelagibius litoralis]|uniref:EAL domain-containing protein n=1 Tax=Pelagibius litoralis TaxID=374515 RepID=A0A967EX95_9PROT|nr:GGDEF domain-containing phosphodiesterase [Pelagibius litoralis]NIA68390.1 EAL domain-containing protein [Pelagibius litoralis]